MAQYPDGDFWQVMSLRGLVLFNICISDTESKAQGTLSKFAEDMKLCNAFDTTEGWDAICKDLDKLEKLAHEIPVIHKPMCKVLQCGQGNHRHQHRLAGEVTESSPGGKHQGGLVDEKLEMSQQCAHRVLKEPRVSWAAPEAWPAG